MQTTLFLHIFYNPTLRELPQSSRLSAMCHLTVPCSGSSLKAAPLSPFTCSVAPCSETFSKQPLRFPIFCSSMQQEFPWKQPLFMPSFCSPRRHELPQSSPSLFQYSAAPQYGSCPKAAPLLASFCSAMQRELPQTPKQPLYLPSHILHLQTSRGSPSKHPPSCFQYSSVPCSRSILKETFFLQLLCSSTKWELTQSSPASFSTYIVCIPTQRELP